MVQLQAINRILKTKDMSLITKNALDAAYFEPYTAEAQFIIDHYNKYKTVPDLETFVATFTDFTPFEVTESEEYLLSGLSEEKMYRDFVPVIQKSAEILKTNANDAVQYLMGCVKEFSSRIGIGATDIIHDAQLRLDRYNEKLCGKKDAFTITTGFKELDDILYGFQRGEEFVVLFARTNQGKSWVLAKMLTHAWQIGNNVGFISPEMSGISIGYRFDTLYKHYDNQSLNYGRALDDYESYIKELSGRDNKFLVSTPADFDNHITINKLRTFVENNNLQILGIDGMSYIRDDRAGRYDKREAELTHISEDLMTLSTELGIPIIGVVQANRDGVKLNDGNLELENIRDADGIAYSASKVIAIRQRVTEETLELSIKKNRNGRVGDKLLYHWRPAVGEFEFIPQDSTDEHKEALRSRFTEKPKGKVAF